MPLAVNPRNRYVITVPTGGGEPRSASLKPLPIENSLPSSARDVKCPELAGKFSFPRLVRDDGCFRIVVRLDLEQRGGASGFIGGLRLAQHQSFPAFANHAIALGEQMGRALAAFLGYDFDEAASFQNGGA
jgi:hypothetical protein